MSRIAAKLLFILVSLALAWGLFRPVPPPDPLQFGDKLGHFLSFAAWSAAALLAIEPLRRRARWSLLLVGAVALEWLQHQVTPVRQLELMDAVANVGGVLVALLLWQAAARWQRRAASAGNAAKAAGDDPAR